MNSMPPPETMEVLNSLARKWLISSIRMRTLETRMPRRRGPPQNFLGKFFHAHAAMRRRYDCEQTLLAQRGQGFHVMFEQRLERLLRLPFRVLRRHHLHAIKCEGKLKIERLFAPQRAIVVERCGAQLGRHEIRDRCAVTRATKSTIDFFVAPSFQEGRGSETCVKTLPARLVASSVASSARRLKRSQRIKTLEAPSCS